MFCNECGAKAEAGVKFCQECGIELSDDNKFCTECGKKLDDDSKFCISCGTEVAETNFNEKENITTREEFLKNQSLILEKQNKYLNYENNKKKDELKTGKCTHCSQIIEFKLKNEGSFAVCPYCSEKTELIIDLEPPKLWNPAITCIISIILTPIFGAYIYKRNWDEVKESRKALINGAWIKWTILIYLLAYITLNNVIDSHSKNGLLIISVSILALLFFSYIFWLLIEGLDFLKYFKEHYEKNYIKKPIAIPSLFFLFILPAICVMFYFFNITITKLYNNIIGMDTMTLIVLGLLMLVGALVFLRAKLSNI